MESRRREGKVGKEARGGEREREEEENREAGLEFHHCFLLLLSLFHTPLTRTPPPTRTIYLYAREIGALMKATPHTDRQTDRQTGLDVDTRKNYFLR